MRWNGRNEPKPRRLRGADVHPSPGACAGDLRRKGSGTFFRMKVPRQETV